MRGSWSSVIRRLDRNSWSNYRTATKIRTASFATDNDSDTHTVTSIFEKLSSGALSIERAKNEILRMKATATTDGPATTPTPDNPTNDQLRPFANLDHDRAARTSFPEVVFAQGKTSEQLVAILDDMAHNVNELVRRGQRTGALVTHAQKAILATRVSKELYEQILSTPLKNGSITYHKTARILTITASTLHNQHTDTQQNTPPPTTTTGTKIIIACAGTTDIPVAEEAAVTLEAAGCRTERVYDVGVAGLHRIIDALPRLRHPDVGCVIVCAGMDGALPSVVAGLVGVPVVAVPTSVGYGASFGGVSAMLTMLNSCAPGVGVVNIDNGFGGAALAHKCIRTNDKSLG